MQRHDVAWQNEESRYWNDRSKASAAALQPVRTATTDISCGGGVWSS